MRKLNVFFLLLLSSCAVFGSAPPVDTKPTLGLKNPPPMKFRSVNFIVVHKDNAEKTFSDLDSSGQDAVLFGLTGDDYKNLAVNTQQLKAYIKHQQKIINLYREYYEGEGRGKIE